MLIQAQNTTPWSVIQTLGNTSSRLEKENILRMAFERDILNSVMILHKGLKLTFDSTITFGVKAIPIKEDSLSSSSLPFSTFLEACENLIARKVTGHAARDLIQNLMSNSNTIEWNDWYRRILIKDLRCGVDIKTVNKVLKDLKQAEIPVFSCQLAQDSAKQEAKMKGTKLLSVKLDGVRVLSIVYPTNDSGVGKVCQFSRNGKELHNFEEVKTQLALHIAPLIEVPVVLDGEIMSRNFQALMKQIYRKDNVNTNDAILYLFDIIPLTDFLLEKYSKSQLERSNDLEALIFKASCIPNVVVLPQVLINLETEEGLHTFKETNKDAIAQGYEGLMLKDPTAPYECKRTSHWLKLKPFIEVSLTIDGVEEGTGKNSNSLGALICSGVEDAKHITVNVGGGFSEKQRKEFWEARDELLGKVVEVRADAITKNQDLKNETYSLRFPRFLRFRGFEVGEKI